MADQHTDGAAQAGEGAAPAAGARTGGLEAHVEVREAPAFTLAYVRHTGPYAATGSSSAGCSAGSWDGQARAGSSAPSPPPVCVRELYKN